jgi:hypothetical protein
VQRPTERIDEELAAPAGWAETMATLEAKRMFTWQPPIGLEHASGSIVAARHIEDRGSESLR